MPNTTQKKTLSTWFNTARWTYNQTVQAIKDGCPKTKQAIREKCIHNNLFEANNRWVRDTPYEIRDSAMNDVLLAYKTNFAAKKQKFEIKFKSKKATSDSIVIGSRQWHKGGIPFPRFFGSIPLKAVEPIPDKLDYDCRLQRTSSGNYYLCIPRPLNIRSENQAPKEKLIALDPGVRTFHTGFTDDSEIMEFGKQDIGKVLSLCRHLDKLQSKWSQPDITHRKRYRLRRAAKRMRTRIQDLVRDCHHKVAKYLCENFTTILLPLFETRHMVSRIKRRIGSKTARAMLTWSHFQFRQRLLDKTREYPWCKVIIVDESFTSKTCTHCGQLHPNLGKNKTYKCPSCEVELDRDANGARNILLKFLTEHKMAEAIRHWVLAPGDNAKAGPSSRTVQKCSL